MSVNVENVNKVADAIEQHSIPDLGFNMGWWRTEADGAHPDRSGHNCGTIACIGGWTETVLQLPPTVSAGQALGLGVGQADRLFCPRGWGDGTHTPAQAVAVLRHLAATGEVDWSVADTVSA